MCDKLHLVVFTNTTHPQTARTREREIEREEKGEQIGFHFATGWTELHDFSNSPPPPTSRGQARAL